MSPEHPLTFRSAVNGWNFHLALTVVFHQTLFKCLQFETRVGREISSLTFNLSEMENCFCHGCIFLFFFAEVAFKAAERCEAHTML